MLVVQRAAEVLGSLLFNPLLQLETISFPRIPRALTDSVYAAAQLQPPAQEMEED